MLVSRDGACGVRRAGGLKGVVYMGVFNEELEAAYKALPRRTFDMPPPHLVRVMPDPLATPCPVFMSTDSAVRKLMPVASGCLNYFPDALLLVSWVSRVGNEKHNPGQPMHWAKGKSPDEPDCEVRHMLDYFRCAPADPGLEPLGELGHLASKAWRALADLQRACDTARAKYEAA